MNVGVNAGYTPKQIPHGCQQSGSPPGIDVCLLYKCNRMQINYYCQLLSIN
nr:MAG TPA: hypothetical protein [Caudoviricetes sp.]